MRTFSIAGRPVGPGAPCFVIAEAGVNHNGDAALALRLVDAAAAAHADAVKFQTFRAEAVAAAEAPKAAYQQASTGGAESQLDMLRRLELSTDGHHAVVERCRDRGILFLSTPFDEQSADFLDAMGVPAFKIPSGELTNAALVSHVARKGRPMIVSTGMATLGEVDEAIRTIAASGNPPVALLQCVTNYPADPATANLRAMHAMAAAFDVPTGYSDHTRGVETALAAVALGACIVEKHFTLDRLLPGPDHAASLEPGELAQLIAQAESQAEHANDFFHFTSRINDHCSQADKAALVEAMWSVAYANGVLDASEIHVISKIAGLLNVPHGEYIAAKLRAKQAAGLD